MKKIVLLAFVFMLLSTAMIGRFIRPAVAEGTIYIMADGSIVGTTDISSADNITYTFIDNIYDEIVVQRDNIVVDGAGYTVQGTGASGSKGIDLSDRNNVTIKNMEIKAFWYGIYLYNSSNCTVSGNNITANNGNGLHLYKCDNNNFMGNNLSNNNFHGILLSYSSNNTLTDNIASNNRYNFGISGYDFSDFNNHIDTSNTVDGKPIYYLKGVSHTVYDAQTNVGTFCLIKCNNITIKDLTLTKNGDGVFLWNSTNNKMENISATNNQYGIWLDHSSNNTLIGNNVSSNEYDGIGLYYSINNTLTDNTAINNSNGIRLYHSSNNAITSNIATNNDWDGIGLGDSNNNTVTGNTNSNNEHGIRLMRSNNNTVTGNTVSNNTHGTTLDDSCNNNTLTTNTVSLNQYGILLDDSSNNTLYHNNFINNTHQVYTSGSVNVWDDCTGKGNYWSDYEERYTNATEIDGSGIWDTPYEIDENNQDNYPIVPEFPSWTSMLLILIMLTVAIATYKRRLLKTPIH